MFHHISVTRLGGGEIANITVVAGRNASLQCNLCSDRGYGYSSIKWITPGDESLSPNRVQRAGCLLNISNTTVEDSGSYTCIATRKYDSKTLRETVFLTVVGKFSLTIYR